MKNNQGGFTLVEIAIVLVIIGLLLGGVLKGQELINSAKVKNLASDFRNVQVVIYGYQDKFKRLPGDDDTAVTNLGSPSNGNRNGTIDGTWNSTSATDESVLFWDHVRRANLSSGPTLGSGTAVASVVPSNAEGGRIGVSGTKPITTMNGGPYYMCSDGIDGKYARQLDLTMDDGNANQGSMMAIAQGTGGATQANGSNGASTSYVDGTKYTVCMTF